MTNVLLFFGGFVVAIAILMMGFELLKTSFSKILHPEAVDTSLLAMGILVCSILVKIYMYCYNHYIGKKLDSDAMQATAMDSLSDTIATSVVLAAMIIMRLTSINVDGFGGLLVAIFILYAGIKAVKDTMDPLLGKAPDQTFVREIRAIVMSHPKVHGIHDLIVHDYGPGRRMITLHLEVPGDEDVFQLHDMIDHIERELDQKLGCEAVIHMDPIETNNAAIAQMKQQVEQKVLEIDRRITIHDFRLINCDTHTGIAVDERPYETFETSDFLPFQAGIQAGADAVLVSHNIVTSMDESLPASLSPAVHQILRDTLGFDGVILTDDLAMDAVEAYAEDGSVAVLAVLAGNDMVVSTDFTTQIPQVIAAVEDGTIPMEQIDQSVARVLSWKYDLGLLGY